MAQDPRTPVLVGAGQVLERPHPDVALVDRPEPVDLMARALEEAALDCGPPEVGRLLLERARSLRVLFPLSWQYANPALLVAQRLGIEPAELAMSAIGGNSPQSLAAASALSIASGEIDVVLITGAECIATRVAARRDVDRPVLPWTTQAPNTPPPIVYGIDRDPVTEFERSRGLDRPLRVFPLFATALRAAAGMSPDDYQRYVSEFWARFSNVAAENPYAWTQREVSAEEIRTVTDRNRMVSYPYPKLMNANDRVDMGAALVMCSLEAARDAGVPDEKMVFPIASADANDHWFLSHRHDLHSSPAISYASRAVLQAADVTIDDVAHLDIYSCFPCAVQIGAAEIGVSLDDRRPLTVTGGLAFAGGPGNNYVTHSLATMAQVLRSDPGSLGLVTGLGWYATKHSIGLWSSTPPPRPFAVLDPQADVDALGQRAAGSDVEGDVTIEAYTVVHDREGRPELGILALRSEDGRRSWGNVADDDTLSSLMTEEGCGRKARLHSDGRTDVR